MKTFFAWYSQEYVDKGFGSCIYRKLDESEVEVTEVSASPRRATRWKDSVFIGMVTEFVRRGVPRAADYQRRVYLEASDEPAPADEESYT